MGGCNNRAVDCSSRVAVDTFTGRIHVEWDPDTAVTPLGQTAPVLYRVFRIPGTQHLFHGHEYSL